jgi:BMFP domain-containing protein YqiC
MPSKGADVLETQAQSLEKNSKGNRKMSDAVFAQGLIREAFPKELYGGYKAAVYAAYRYMSPRVSKRFTERRARAIWDGEARRIDMEEADVLRSALIEEARNEKQRLRARLASLDEKIAAAEAVAHRQAVAGPGQ